MDNNKIMLIYGFSEKDKKILLEIIQDNNLPKYKIIEKSMAKMKIQDIIMGFEFDIFNSSMPDEKLILFNNFEDNELDKAINEIKSKMDKSIILAAVTPTSINWTFEELLNHLEQEKEWFEKFGK